jgi:hypothetical protein
MIADQSTGFPGGPRISIPETELYEILQIQRRRLVNWMGYCRQGVLDAVMQEALQVVAACRFR